MALMTFSAIFLLFLAAVYLIGGLFWRTGSFPGGEKVAVVEVEGVILSARQINERLIRFREDPQVKAIVLRINSPGGGVGPSQEIFSEVKKTNDQKPVVVSMGAVAASGGYYVAAPARRIFANPGTITGSIGVIMEFTNIQELLEKIGLSATVVKSGAHKDIGSPVRPMSEEDRAILQNLIDDVHGQFVSAIVQGRNMDEARVRELADGRIFSGERAREIGLVDELGNLQDAIKAAGELAGIEGEPKVVYPAKDSPKLLDYLIEQSLQKFFLGMKEERFAQIQFLWSGR